MKKAFTILELIFVIVIIGILAGIAIPRYLAMRESSHEANLISFVRTLNRTTGVDLWSKSISEGKKGKIKNLTNNWPVFLSKYIKLPTEIKINEINFSKCGDQGYNTVATSSNVLKGEYNITCKDGTATTAPYFKLIRIKDNKTLVSRE